MCEVHREEYDTVNRPWPVCPKCGENEFGYMKWGGDVESTQVSCNDCGFSDKAIKHFDHYTILNIASPINYKT